MDKFYAIVGDREGAYPLAASGATREEAEEKARALLSRAFTAGVIDMKNLTELRDMHAVPRDQLVDYGIFPG